MPLELILFGGSFDPFHLAHLEIIKQARQKKPNAKVVVMPAGTSPFKQVSSVSKADRLQIIRLSLEWAFGADAKNILVSEWELERPGPSYTFDTVVHLKNQYGVETITVLIGSDNLATLPQWYRFSELRPQIKLLVFRRHGVLEGTAMLTPADEFLPAEMPDISSTKVREALSKHEPALAFLAPPAYQFIVDRGIYGTGSFCFNGAPS